MFNKVEFIQPDADPLQSPTKRRKRRPWLLLAVVAGVLACCVLSGFSLSRTFAQAAATEPPPPSDTLPAPAVRVTNPNSQIETALAPMSNALTPSPTAPATNTAVVLWTNTPTPGC